MNNHKKIDTTWEPWEPPIFKIFKYLICLIYFGTITVAYSIAILPISIGMISQILIGSTIGLSITVALIYFYRKQSDKIEYKILRRVLFYGFGLINLWIGLIGFAFDGKDWTIILILIITPIVYLELK